MDQMTSQAEDKGLCCQVPLCHCDRGEDSCLIRSVAVIDPPESTWNSSRQERLSPKEKRQMDHCLYYLTSSLYPYGSQLDSILIEQWLLMH